METGLNLASNDSFGDTEQSMRLLIADDHDMVRDAIASFLENEGVTEIVKASTLGEAIEMVRASGAYDLVLLDYNMPGMNGLSGLTEMKEANDNRPVAILSGTASPNVAKDALQRGAAGFLPKTLAARSMISAIRFMAAGKTYVPIEFLQDADGKTVGNLTQRETEVLRCLIEGKSNKEIARDLDLQEVTIKLHVKTLCRKLDAKNRTHAAMIARDQQLL